jgi:hypothetical protein
MDGGRGRGKEEKSKIRSLDGALGFRKGTNTPERLVRQTRGRGNTRKYKKSRDIEERNLLERTRRRKKK